MGRRGAIHTTAASIGGLVTLGLLPPASAPAAATPTVTPNPIRSRIQKSGVAVEIVEFCTPPASSANRPRALLNYLGHAGDGTGYLYACDSRGRIWRIDHRSGRTGLFFDLAAARGAAFVTGHMVGLRSFAFHPDFARPGRPGHGKLYTAHTEAAASWRANVKLFRMRPTVPVRLHNVIAEWSVRPTDRAVVDPGSRREVLRIAQHGEGHCLDQLLFNPNRRPGEPGYGLMFAGVGDGGNTPEWPDRYGHAQDPSRALGKILRINPLPGRDVRYRVPTDNPFVGRPGVLPEIWALGLRHPQNLSFDRGGRGVLLVTDIGQAQVEEINLGATGANYGWPLREGTFATKPGDQDVLHRLPAVDGWRFPGETRLRPFTYPAAQYDRSEGLDATGRPIMAGWLGVTGGCVYRGRALPRLFGHYLCGDLVNGRIFHVPVDELRAGTPVRLRELTLTRDGRAVTLAGLVGARDRVDLRIGEGEDGSVYILTKQDGKIRKLAS